jgi:2-C-methyl-D-erythritol 4-phosphate cytidylyltransferase
MTRHFALVPAAGTGARLGASVPKQYLVVAGRPLVWHAVASLLAHAAIGRVAVVLHPDDRLFERQPWAELGGRVAALRCGGATRAESVRNGLVELRAELDDDDWMLVHDAARPCLSLELLQRLLETLDGDGIGGLLAVPVADTLKRASADQRVLRTEPRDGLWRAQTPQMFRYGLLSRALDRADLASVTDEASAVEALGASPRLVAGSERNVKVTYPEDLALAELILKQRELPWSRT